MPLFKNVGGDTIRTQIGERLYEVPPGKVCEIGEEYLYLLAPYPRGRGLGLSPVSYDDAQGAGMVPSRRAPPPRPARVPGVVSGALVHNALVEEDPAPRGAAPVPSDALDEGEPAAPAPPPRKRG